MAVNTVTHDVAVDDRFAHVRRNFWHDVNGVDTTPATRAAFDAALSRALSDANDLHVARALTPFLPGRYELFVEMAKAFALTAGDRKLSSVAAGLSSPIPWTVVCSITLLFFVLVNMIRGLYGTVTSLRKENSEMANTIKTLATDNAALNGFLATWYGGFPSWWFAFILGSFGIVLVLIPSIVVFGHSFPVLAVGLSTLVWSTFSLVVLVRLRRAFYWFSLKSTLKAIALWTLAATKATVSLTFKAVFICARSSCRLTWLATTTVLHPVSAILAWISGNAKPALFALTAIRRFVVSAIGAWLRESFGNLYLLEHALRDSSHFIDYCSAHGIKHRRVKILTTISLLVTLLFHAIGALFGLAHFFGMPRTWFFYEKVDVVCEWRIFTIKRIETHIEDMRLRRFHRNSRFDLYGRIFALAVHYVSPLIVLALVWVNWFALKTFTGAVFSLF